MLLDGPETNRAVTTEEDHDYDENELQDYRLLKVDADRSADFIANTLDGTFHVRVSCIG